MKVAHAAALIVFLGFAALQWNDPDGLIWILTYLVAATVAFFGLLRIQQRLIGVVTAVVFLVAAWRSAPGADHNWIAEESGREALGLLICASWSVVVVLDSIGVFRSRQTSDTREVGKHGVEC